MAKAYMMAPQTDRVFRLTEDTRNRMEVEDTNNKRLKRDSRKANKRRRGKVHAYGDE